MNNLLGISLWDIQGVVVPFIVFVICPTIVFLFVTLSRKHRIDKQTEVMLAAVEKGMDINPETFGKPSLAERRRKKFESGLACTILGFVFIVIGFCTAGSISLLSLLFFVPGGVLLAIGAAPVISYFVNGDYKVEANKQSEEKKSE